MSRIVLSLVVLAMLVSAPQRGWSAEPTGQIKVYQPAGAPADPKVPARWNKYHDHAEATAMMTDLVKAYPELAHVQSLGKSYEGRDIWLMTISAPGTLPSDKKPAFYIDGGIHANEIQATEVVLYTAWYLLESYERSPFIKKLLQERTIYLAPDISPDSRHAHFYEPNTTNSPRSGQRPVDDDQDGLLDEDPPDDLNGDGHISQMRVRDPNGRYKPHADFPDLMILVKPGEKGMYRLLGAEGIDNDGDGRVNEDGDGYTDPNRDWAWGWQPGHIQGGAFRYPFSLIENRQVADFLKSHPNIAGLQSYHNTGGMLLRGPGSKDERYEPADIAVYNVLGKTGEKMLPGYRYINTAEDLYEVYGGETDFAHQMLGIFSFTNELNTPFNMFRKAAEGGDFFGRAEDQQTFNKLLLFGDAMVPWTEVDHPLYGKVEVGGNKKNLSRQPPSFLLEEECHRNMAFTLYHADQMPLVGIQSISSRTLAGGLTEITAIVTNERVTPTHSAADVNRKITRPDAVTISGRDLKVVAAMTADEPYFLSPSEHRRNPETVKLPTISGFGIVYVRWIVQQVGSPAVQIEVDSVKGGAARKSFP